MARVGAFLTSAICLLLCAITLAAFQGPVFRTGITHVLVDVVVTDKDDRPVTDLTADEFVITEGDRPQTIADFEHVSVQLGSRTLDLATIPAPPPDAFSNAPPPRTGRAFQFVMSHIAPADIVPVQRALLEFLRTLTPDDEVAVTFPGGRSDLNQDFTRDPGLVIRAIKNIGAQTLAGTGHGWRSGEMLKIEITALANTRENRRAIIFVAYGGPTPKDQEVVEAYELAKRLDVPIYAFDPQGLPTSVLDEAKQNMRTLAEQTNGLAFVHYLDVTAAIHELVADNSSYYLLGFYPSPYVADGKFHDITVSVTRPGLKVRARSGYPTEKPLPADAPPPRLVDSLEASVPGGDLILHAFAASVAPAPKGARTLLTLHVAYPESPAGAPRRDDQLELTWLALDRDAAIKAKGGNTINVPLAAASRDALTLAVEDGLELPKGPLMLRVAVASRLLGTHGTVYVPIDVPDLAKAELEAGHLVLGLDGGPLTRLATLGQDLGGVPFQPTPLRTFSFGRQFRVFTRVFAAKLTDVTAALVLKQGETVIKTLPISAAPSKVAKNALDCEASFPFKGLAAGAYVLELTVSDGAKHEVQRALTFEIK